eukprot:Hpha_TRINITY_DN13732_c0_g1::TRINITY_DN13732_c0_g1_i1::g.142583::m.142583
MGCGCSIGKNRSKMRRDSNGVDELAKLPVGQAETTPQLGYDDTTLAEFEQQLRRREEEEETRLREEEEAEEESMRRRAEREAEEERQREADYSAFEKELEEEQRKLLADLSSGRIQQDVFTLDGTGTNKGNNADVICFDAPSGETPRERVRDHPQNGTPSPGRTPVNNGMSNGPPNHIVPGLKSHGCSSDEFDVF